LHDFDGMFDVNKAISEFVSHPSVSADPQAAEGMHGAVRYLSTLLHDHCGCDVEVVKTPRHPVVIGRRKGDPSWPHVVIYGHYDVQPADPIAEWRSHPFETVVKDGVIYGRGVADDKGPLLVHIAAVARLFERRPDLPLNVTFLVEGEEEIGSPNLTTVMEAYKDSLKGDFVLMSDTGAVSVDEEIITTGLRGLICLEVRLHGPSHDLHSGLYGGPVMNPIRALAKLCASLHDENGRVNIPGFYDGIEPPAEWEKEELRRMNDDEASYKAKIGVSTLCPPKGVDPFEALCFLPTLEFNGITGGYQGPGSKTIIPAKASVKISCRLVPGQTTDGIASLLEKTLRQRCPEGVRIEVEREHGGDPYMVLPPHLAGRMENSPKSRAFDECDKAIRDVFGVAPHYLRDGASVPILADIRRVLGMDALMLGVALPESRLHSPNENLDLRIVERASKVSERILEAVAGK
jgi:acetylornithine deacetylase/succinyl-diaminopimelate desuccinylase-like protein